MEEERQQLLLTPKLKLLNHQKVAAERHSLKQDQTDETLAEAAGLQLDTAITALETVKAHAAH